MGYPNKKKSQNGGVSEASWGDIVGNLLNQEDLVEKLTENLNTILGGAPVDANTLNKLNLKIGNVATQVTGLAHTSITNIDLKPTQVANQFTVEISWTDADGNAQVTSDPTPITIIGGDGASVNIGSLAIPNATTTASTEELVTALANKADANITVTSLTASRSTTSSDNGAFLENNTVNDYTITVEANTVSNGFLASQRSTGNVVLVAGSGVTFVGDILSTVNAGDFISLTKTATANTFIVSVSLQAQTPSAFTSRALTNTDNNKTLVPSDASQIVTVNTGLIGGFSCFINNNATVTAGAGVTVNDKRTSGATNPTFSIVNTGDETYALIGSKT